MIGRTLLNQIKAKPFTQQLNTVRFNSTVAQPRMGGFRGGLIGFLVGATVAGSTGYYFLIHDYQVATGLLLHSIRELQLSADKVREYARQIESVANEIAKLKDSTAKIDQIDRLKGDIRKLYDSVGVEVLDLKGQLTDLEKDVNILVKNSSNRN
ncbi:hypothetical protein CONCODRAFT_77988 [Conidiobolus coronatus NRRL 28638]|uniref:Uncharacterized protein n=1 Tax=Conidiobolus coronatus (strain ATCC 28846 / CBS 209.66 / NRRL 28638) TaxID=796925 RepID=A0A137PAZ8_CONC2|nr:hypothetical protein CONCODRAFT_77988 [Conidiobolus coronatus NRRL 28638]|eukprot:KXN72102.1 hypothetical protein CONCODRAFT_77988 [Conidiobolus coronatus NRRL 28638]